VVSTASHMICTDYLRLISGPKVTLWQLTSVSVEDDSKRSMLKLSRRTNIMHLRTRQSMQYCIYTTCTFITSWFRTMPWSVVPLLYLCPASLLASRCIVVIQSVCTEDRPLLLLYLYYLLLYHPEKNSVS
jgi:hypothetical protein